MNLDDGSRMEPCGFAGLAGYSLRMRPYKMYETGTHCSVADHFQVMNEPNDVPKLGFQVLANRQIDIMHFKHRTGGRDRTLVAGSWLRSFPCCSNRVCSRNDDVHYHSGNFDSALVQQQFAGEMSVAGVTRNYFQCNTGNFHVDKFHGNWCNNNFCYFQSGSGNLQTDNFQCNSGYFDNAVLVTSATWQMQAVDSYRISEHYVCRAGRPQQQLVTDETCGEAGSISEFLDGSGIEISTVECLRNHGCTDMDNFSIEFSSAGDGGTAMIGLTTLSSFSTLMAGGFNLAHDGLQGWHFAQQCSW